MNFNRKSIFTTTVLLISGTVAIYMAEKLIKTGEKKERDSARLGFNWDCVNHSTNLFDAVKQFKNEVKWGMQRFTGVLKEMLFHFEQSQEDYCNEKNEYDDLVDMDSKFIPIGDGTSIMEYNDKSAEAEALREKYMNRESVISSNFTHSVSLRINGITVCAFPEISTRIFC